MFGVGHEPELEPVQLEIYTRILGSVIMRHSVLLFTLMYAGFRAVGKSALRSLDCIWMSFLWLLR